MFLLSLSHLLAKVDRQSGLESQKHHAAVAVPEYNWILVNKFGQNLLKCQLRSQRLGR